jgi:hypothetical protein
VIAKLAPIAQREGLTLGALALAWVYSRPAVSVVLAGARTPEQVDDNLSGARRLSLETLAAIDQVAADEFRPARATPEAIAQAAAWGARERFIVERLDGRCRYEAIAAAWTDRGQQPMIAAQIKTLADDLNARGLLG